MHCQKKKHYEPLSAKEGQTVASGILANTAFIGYSSVELAKSTKVGKYLVKRKRMQELNDIVDNGGPVIVRKH